MAGCDVVEIRLNSGLTISLHADGEDLGWFDTKSKSGPTEREMWQRMAFLIQNTDFEAVKKLYGSLPPEPVLNLKATKDEGP